MEPKEKLSRPKEVKGFTVRAPTGCGKMYVILNSIEGKLFEVFAGLGKSGGCAKCQSEALSRCISLGLRYGIPAEEFANQLQGICCDKPIWDNGKTIKSCPDALAQIIKTMVTV